MEFEGPTCQSLSAHEIKSAHLQSASTLKLTNGAKFTAMTLNNVNKYVSKSQNMNL